MLPWENCCCFATQKLYDDALIVMAADHGRGLGEHGEETHGVFLYDETIHVPLLLKLPQNQGAAKRVAARASLVDVAPSVLAIAGLPVPAQMQGQSLLSISKTNSDQPAYSVSDFPQRAFGWSALESWRAGKYLYIKAPKPELYDLSADPGATRNLAQTSKATLETIAGQLDAFDRRFSNPGASAGPELTSGEMQKLASLGYVGMQKSTGPSTAATGVDPKDGIANANKVLSALAQLDEGKPEKAQPYCNQCWRRVQRCTWPSSSWGLLSLASNSIPRPLSICATPSNSSPTRPGRTMKWAPLS